MTGSTEAGMRFGEPEGMDLQDLVDRYLPEYHERTPLLDRLGLHLLTFVLVGWASMGVPALVPSSAADVVGRLALLALVPVSVASAEWVLWRRRTRGSDAIERDLRSGRLLERLSERFRREVEKHRSQMLGPGAEWSSTRETLVRARDEADRQVAYWTERSAGNDSAEIGEHLDLAQELRSKYSNAIRELDRRGDAILGFINRCEAKLSALETAQRDQAQSARLLQLSAEAEDAISHAHHQIRNVADSFLDEALQIANALHGLHEVRLLERASIARIEEIEPIAEEIAASAMADQVRLRELQQALDQGVRSNPDLVDS